MAISPKVVEMSVEDVVASPAISDAFLERNPSNWNIVELEDGTMKDYRVLSSKWDFTHFGDTLVLTIEPVKKRIT